MKEIATEDDRVFRRVDCVDPTSWNHERAALSYDTFITRFNLQNSFQLQAYSIILSIIHSYEVDENNT